MKEAEAFNAYDEELNLDPAERRRAEVFHNDLTEYLRQRGLISSAFLQGSFARKTMLKPLRDIDKVVILSADQAHLRDDYWGAQKAADLIEDALREQYPEATFSRTRHAIQMDLGEDTFSFDVVVAVEVSDGSGDVWITDLGEDLSHSGWKRSNTRQLIQVIRDRNKDCGRQFVHQVRHAKHFVRTKLSGVLPGLHVEAIAYACVTTKMTHAEAAENILSCGAALLAPGAGYDDPTGAERLSDKLTPTERLLAHQAFTEAAAAARRARELAEARDDGGAIGEWFSIFGPPFPKRDPKQVLSTAFSSRISESGTPSRHASGTKATPKRSWRQS